MTFDADDWIDSDYLHQIFIRVSDQLDVLIADYILEPSKRIVQTHYEKDKMLSGYDLMKTNPYVHTANDACFSWRMVFRTDFLRKHKLLPNTNIVIGEDTEFNLRCISCAKKVLAVSYAGYHYRTNNNSSLMHQRYKRTLESDLHNQYPTRRNSFKGIAEYEHDMAVYYVTNVLYRVIENTKVSCDGLQYDSLKRILNSVWLRESYTILGNDLKVIIHNRNEYILQLAIKYRLTWLVYLYLRR